MAGGGVGGGGIGMQIKWTKILFIDGMCLPDEAEVIQQLCD